MSSADIPESIGGQAQDLVGRAVFPLSFAQQRLWFLDQLEPGSAAYNVPVALRLRGDLDVAALENSLSEIRSRHDVLRTSFPVRDGQPVQLIAGADPLTVPEVDLRGFPRAAREAEANRLAAEDAAEPFDLAHGPMLRAKRLRLSDDDHVLLLTMHHIVSDGWSLGVLFRELSGLYDSFRHGRPSPLPELPIQYADYAVWQRNRLQGEFLEKELSYWKEKLGGSPPVLALPTDKERSAALSSQPGRIESAKLGVPLLQALGALSQRENATRFMTLLAAFQVLLARYTGQDDIWVGSPIAGRMQAETEGLIGFFVNTLVLRGDVSGDPSFRELLGRVRETALEAYAHQDLPFEKLVEELQPPRILGNTPLFRVMFTLRNPGNQIEIPGLTVEWFPAPRGASHFDLSLGMVETANGLSCSFEFNTDLFEVVTVRRMLAHLEVLLEGIAADPDRRLSQLPLLTAGERHQVVVWNQTEAEYPEEKTVHGLFEEQVERTPEAVAVEFEGKRLTYGELNRRSNQLARHLRGLGVGPEVLVGLCLERSLEMVVSLFGILKAGGAYLPLDPAYPPERLRFMLEDSGASVVVTHQAAAESLPPSPARTVFLDASWETIARESGQNFESRVAPRDLAYVIYTSGSTGKPKGVEIEHRSLTNYAWFVRNRFGLRTGERVLQFASLSFDVAAEEIFSTLLGGATLVLRSEEMIETVATFLAKCREWDLTVLDLPTSYWHEMVAVASAESLDLPETVRLVIVGGERALPERFVQWRELAGERVRFLNGYGPTEATVAATFWEPSTGTAESPPRTVPIGRPIPNVRTYVLDGTMQPVPVGLVGELYVGGIGVARGYRNRPELTRERFVPDPFMGGDERLYKTGDRVRYRADGDLEYLGRVDGQVKLRGFRVELGEVETALLGIIGVREAHVQAREEVPGETRLVGYVVPDPAASLSVSDLRRLLAENLPAYMVPSTFVTLEKLPRMPSGKLDLAALPSPEPGRPELDSAYQGPRTPLEETLAEIWMKVLRLDRVGVHDDFFDLGGHSLLATQVISRARDAFHIEIPLRDLFLYPTIAELALAIAQRQAERVAPADMDRILSELEAAMGEGAAEAR